MQFCASMLSTVLGRPFGNYRRDSFEYIIQRVANRFPPLQLILVLANCRCTR